jgi:tRNA G18 (ribose-2'-O)-methylase SpoU
MAPRVLPVSTANAAFQRLEVLQRNRTKRHRYGEFVVEGVRAINSAIANGWTIRAFAYARERELSRWATSILAASSAESHFEIAPELFDRLSGKEEPSELLAVLAMRPDSLDRITVTGGMTVVVIDRPVSPGNVGTIIRSCDAFGVSGLMVTGHGVDLYDPATIERSRRGWRTCVERTPASSSSARARARTPRCATFGGEARSRSSSATRRAG